MAGKGTRREISKKQRTHSGLMCVKRQPSSRMTLKEMFKPKLLVNLREIRGRNARRMGLKSYCCEIKFQLCGRSCRTKDVGPGRIAFGGPAESSFCYFYTSLPWNLLCWPFVSDLGHRTAKTQASVKIKLVSTYSLSLFFHI